jgi:transcriptional regulator with XRE-family HTH domain
MSNRTKITGAQVRMARAFLRWSVSELAAKAKVGISTVQRIEASDGSPMIADDLEWRAAARNEVLAAVKDTLIRAGITFLAEDRRGMGIRGKLKGSRPSRARRLTASVS